MRDNLRPTWPFTLNEMAVTHLPPDGLKSQKQRRKKGGLLRRHKTDPSQDHNDNTKHRKGKDVLPTVGLCASG